MITLVVSVVPQKLRGHLTRWLFEVHPNVFVGKVNARVRDNLWNLVRENVSTGKAVMTYPDSTQEQGFAIRTHHSQWEMRDFDGLILPLRPAASAPSKTKAGWSHVSRRRANARRKRK
ncbi:type I-E CRISPR-associated endoribonuclease Cas2e [Corynebacterium dentalis]|uniref:type I-E CRISPR-associated endoribonuclease Cas2e n=1 Tax=Corynebacterium dentalis TaxID=2014528 RepID=UPI000C08007E|nr:type I-E CRISPR-associated endoribonuclease Cas2e [Corynebacterium dentalis]